MKNPLRRSAVGAVALGAIAGSAALGLHSAAVAWQPVTYGLHETPAQLLPATVSTAHPVRVVSTKVDSAGRPVVTVHTATDKTTAAKYVAEGQKASNAVGVELDAVTTAESFTATGTDPMRSQQWDLGTMSVGDAWLKSTGTGVTVAVLDTGVDASNPDLAGQVLTGYDETTGKDGANTDPNGHGTHVAGTIAADTGNGVGVSSVAPGAKILPVRVLGANGSGYMSDTATGIIYAADHGANVINMSLGATAQVTAVTNAIAYARSKGVVVVAAAGNSRENGSPVSYPGADPGVIAVAATDSTDTVASYSNQGSYVDVAAPGSAILSTYPTALNKSGYATLYGTSMASPHVAAEAALIKAYRPALTPDQIEQAIESSAVDLGAKGKDTDYGYGRVNAAAGLIAAAAMTSSSPAASPSASRTTTVPATEPTRTVSPTPTMTVSPTPSRTTVAPTPTPSRTTASPAPKIHPAITVSPLTQTVVAGSMTSTTFTVTGAAGKPWAQQPVQICLTPAGGVASCTRGVTGTNGSIQVGVQATGSFQLTLIALATDTSEAVTSATATVSVRSQLTVTRTAPGALTAKMSGAAGQTVAVQRQDGDKWVAVSTYRAEASHALTGLVTGKTYRLVVPSTTAVTGVTSASVQA
jgi:serine protease